jgi:hypothetical protein
MEAQNRTRSHLRQDASMRPRRARLGWLTGGVDSVSCRCGCAISRRCRCATGPRGRSCRASACQARKRRGSATGIYLAAIMHHEGRFCVLVGGARVGDPSGWIGVRQLAVQRRLGLICLLRRPVGARGPAAHGPDGISPSATARKSVPSRQLVGSCTRMRAMCSITRAPILMRRSRIVAFRDAGRMNTVGVLLRHRTGGPPQRWRRAAVIFGIAPRAGAD